MGEPGSGRTSSVDAVVVAYNSARHLPACVEALARSDGVSVFVVDNASVDDSLASIEGVSVTVLPQSRNLGFAGGCNVGWRAGQSPFVLFVNPDATLDAGSLSVLVGVLDAEQSIGLVGPRIEDGQGELAFSQRRFPRLRSTFSQAFYLQRIFPGGAWSDEVVRSRRLYEQARDVEWLSGACLLVRRELLERVGGWDESFFLYSEDTEICRAAWSAGFRVRYEPAAVARHAGGASAPRGELLATLARSRVSYARKNSSPAVALAHRVGIALEALTHTVVCSGGLAKRRGHARALLAAFERVGSRDSDSRAAPAFRV